MHIVQWVNIAVNSASRTLGSLHYARATLFQRHAALLVANNAVYLMRGFDFEAYVIRIEIIHSTVAVRNIVVFPKSLLLVQTVKIIRLVLLGRLGLAAKDHVLEPHRPIRVAFLPCARQRNIVKINYCSRLLFNK